MAKRELQDRVTEELEALIIKTRALGLIAHTGMSEGFGKKPKLAERVTEDTLKGFHVSLFAVVPWYDALAGAGKNGVTDGIRTRNNQNHNLGLYL